MKKGVTLFTYQIEFRSTIFSFGLLIISMFHNGLANGKIDDVISKKITKIVSNVNETILGINTPHPETIYYIAG